MCRASGFLPAGLSGLAGSPAHWQAGTVRGSKVPPGSIHPVGCGDPGGHSPPSLLAGGGRLSLGLPVEVGAEPCAPGAGGGERRRQGGVSMQPCPLASSGLLLTESWERQQCRGKPVSPSQQRGRERPVASELIGRVRAAQSECRAPGCV